MLWKVIVYLYFNTKYNNIHFNASNVIIQNHSCNDRKSRIGLQLREDKFRRQNQVSEIANAEQTGGVSSENRAVRQLIFRIGNDTWPTKANFVVMSVVNRIPAGTL